MRAVVVEGWVVAAMGMAVVRAAAVRAAAMVAVSQARRPYPMHAHEHRLAVIK